MKKTLIFLLLALCSLPFASCKKDSQGKSTLLPNISGEPSDVLVLLHKELWTDSIGLTYSQILEDQFPYLPQIEPLFHPIMLSPTAFSSMFKTFRNIIQTNISEKVKTPSIVIRHDMWAAPQTVVIVSSPSYKQAVPYLRENRDVLVNIFEQAERDRYISTANKYSEYSVTSVLAQKRIKMSVPKGYKMNAHDANFAWFSSETPQTSQGIIMFRFPYRDSSTLTSSYLTEKRNEFVKRIPGPSSGSYMITGDVVPPSFSSMMYKKQYRGVLRGFWDVYHHPMGGPFIGHVLIDHDRQEVLYAEAYVYAPSKTKRDLLRQTEALLFSIEIIKDEGKKDE